MTSESKSRFRRPESVLVVVHTADGLTLLLRRTPPRRFWQSVTGTLKWHGETRTEAAVRELYEETGIETAPDQLRNWNRCFRFRIPPVLLDRYEEGVRTNQEHLFSIQLPAKQPVRLQHDEHSDFQWVDIRAAQRIVWSWTNREALEMIERERIESADPIAALDTQ